MFSIAHSNEDNLLNDVLGTLERMVEYYRTILTDLHLDALYGLRVLEGESTLNVINFHFIFRN